jgi:hypothetical protein
MQLVSLELDHYNFFSPSSGEVIMDGEVFYEKEKSLLGYWIDEFWRDPHINSEEVEMEWQNYLSKFDEMCLDKNFVNEFQSLEDFFANLKYENVIVFKITDRLPSTPSFYLLIDMNYCESNN